MSIQALDSLLWNQRQLLETLTFKLETELLLLTAGKSRWLTRATAEIEAVLEHLRDAELARTVESAAVAAELGLEADVTLAVLADHAPPQWQQILIDHRTALIQLTSEIEHLTESNRELLSTSQRAVRETLSNLEGSTATYTASGTAATDEPSPRLLDQDL